MPADQTGMEAAQLVPLLRIATGIGHEPLSIHIASPGGACCDYVLGGFCLTAAKGGAASSEANVISTLGVKTICGSECRSIEV